MEQPNDDNPSANPLLVWNAVTSNPLGDTFQDDTHTNIADIEFDPNGIGDTISDATGGHLPLLMWEHLEGYWQSDRNFIEVFLTRAGGNRNYVLKAYVLFDGNHENYQRVEETTTRFKIDEWHCHRKNQTANVITWENTKNDEIVLWRKVNHVPPTMKRLDKKDVVLYVSAAGHRPVNGSYSRRGMSEGVAKYCKRIGGTEYEVARMADINTKKQMWWLYKCNGTGYNADSVVFYMADHQGDTPPDQGWRTQRTDVKAPPPSLELTEKYVDIRFKTSINKGDTRAREREETMNLPTQCEPVPNQEGIYSCLVKTSKLIDEIENVQVANNIPNQLTHIRFMKRTCKKINVEKGDELISIADKRIIEFESVQEVIDELHRRKEGSCPITIMRVSERNVRWENQKTFMEARVKTVDLKEAANRVLSAGTMNISFKASEKLLFVERNDVLLRVNGIELDDMSLEAVKVLISTLEDIDTVIYVRKEEARKMQHRRRLLAAEHDLRTYFDIIKQVAIKKQAMGYQDSELSKLIVFPKFDTFQDILMTGEEMEDVDFRRIRIYFYSKFPLSHSAEILISFSNGTWTESGVFYEMTRVKLEHEGHDIRTNTAFIEMVIPVPKETDDLQIMKKYLFSMNFTIRVGAKHYTLSQQHSFEYAKHAMLVDYTLYYHDIRSLLDIMSPEMLTDSLFPPNFLELLTPLERKRLKNPNAVLASSEKKIPPWVTFIGIHLAEAITEYPLHMLLQWASNVQLRNKTVSDMVSLYYIQPIIRKTEKRRASFDELLQIAFWHLIFSVYPSPQECYQFVSNCMKFMENGDSSTVFQMWADQLAERDIYTWKVSVVDTCTHTCEKYIDCQQMAVYVNFVNCVAITACPEETEWAGAKRRLRNELSEVTRQIKMSRLHKSLESRLFNMDIQFANVKDGRIFPVEYVHLERYIGVIERKQQNNGFVVHRGNQPTSSQKKKAFERTMKYVKDTMDGSRGEHLDDEKKKTILKNFLMHYSKHAHTFMTLVLEYKEMIEYLSQHDMYDLAVEAFAQPLAETVKTVSGKYSQQTLVRVLDTYPEMLTANVRKEMLDNFEIQPRYVMQFAFRDNLEEGRENTIVYGAKMYFLHWLKKYDAKYVFNFWRNKVGLQDIMIQGAVDALKEHIEAFSGFDLIINYLDNNIVHELDERILDVVYSKVEEIDKLDLNEEQQTQLRDIITRLLRDGNPEKVKLWNSILTQVIPINSEMNLAHQIRDVCTSLANVVTMVQNLTATVDKENLPARIVEFQKYHTDMVLGVQNRCKDGSVKMGILETIYTLEKDYTQLAKRIEEFDVDLLKQTIKTFKSLNNFRGFFASLTPRYVPPNDDFLAEDLQKFLHFGTETLGNWDDNTLKDIQDCRSLELEKTDIRKHMAYLRRKQDSLVYKSIWQVAFNAKLQAFENPTHRRFSPRVQDFLIKEFGKLSEPSLKLMRQEELATYLQKVYGYSIPEVPRELWTPKPEEVPAEPQPANPNAPPPAPDAAPADPPADPPAPVYEPVENVEDISGVYRDSNDRIVFLKGLKVTIENGPPRVSIWKNQDQNQWEMMVSRSVLVLLGFNAEKGVYSWAGPGMTVEWTRIDDNDDVTKWKADQEEKKKASDQELFDQAGSMIDNVARAFTLNDFIEWHLSKRSKEILEILTKIGLPLKKKDLYQHIESINISDAGISDISGMYENVGGRYIMKTANDMQYEIRKIMDDETDDIWWDIARVDRNDNEEDVVFFTSERDTFLPPDRKNWQIMAREYDPAPRIVIDISDTETARICLNTLFGDILGRTKNEIQRLSAGLKKGHLSIDDLLLYFKSLQEMDEQSIYHELQWLFRGIDEYASTEIYMAFQLAREISFLQDLCKVARVFGENSGRDQKLEEGEAYELPELDERFLAIENSVAEVDNLKKVADSVKGAAEEFRVVQDSLGDMAFTDSQKAWIQQLALNVKVIVDMANEAHLNDNDEFSNLLELLDANQTSQIDAQRSVSLRKVRQLMQKHFIRTTFKSVLEVVQVLSNVETNEGDFDDLMTVSESLDQIKRTYNEASGDSLARDKRILGDALDYGFFDLVNPSLVSGLENVELARKCMTLIVDPAMRADSKMQKIVVPKKRAKWKEDLLKRLKMGAPLVADTSMIDRSAGVVTPPSMKRARTGPESLEEDVLEEYEITTRENLGVTLMIHHGMRLKVHEVEEDSLGDQLGIAPGDLLEKINGRICWDPASSMQKFMSEQELPFTISMKKPNMMVPPSMKRVASIDLLVQRNSKYTPAEVHAMQATRMASIARSPADTLLTNTIMATSSTGMDSAVEEEENTSLVRPTTLLTEQERQELAEKKGEEEAYSFEKMAYESVESMLDRLLMAILRKDAELKENTTVLEAKFKIVERICGYRCQYFILGGRAGLVDTKRIYVSQPIDALKSLEIQWEDRLKQFILSTSLARDEYSWLNYYTMNEVLALNDVLNANVLKCNRQVEVSCGTLKEITGNYYLDDQLVHGRPVYRNDETGLVIWWNSQSKLWCISMEKDIDSMEVYACCSSMDYDPVSCSGGDWTVYSEEEKAFVKGQIITIKESGGVPTAEELQLDVMTHLRFSKPNLDMDKVQEELKNWDVMENEDENLLQEIGAFLDHALGDAEVSMYKQIPDFAKTICGIEDGKPNLYIADPQKSLSSVLNIFLQRNLVPTASQILVCSKHTTQEEVEILLRRCFDVAAKVQLGSNGLAPLFCIAFPENLTNDVMKRVLRICQDYLLSDEAMVRFKNISYCFAMVSCARDNKLTQRFLQFERDRTEMSFGEAQALYNMVLCQNDTRYQEQTYGSEIKPYVNVYSSKNVGAGKSFLIKKWAEKNEADLVRVPVNSTDLQPAYVIKRLKQSANSERRAIHFDVSSCAGSSVNLVLFKLVILQHICASGLRYQVSSRDALLIELPTTLTISGDEIEQWGRDQTGGGGINLGSVDNRFYFTSVNAGLPRREITMDNNPFVLGPKEQFVLKYLRAYDMNTRVANGGLLGTGADWDPDFEPDAAEAITDEECIDLLGKYCPEGKESRILQKCFLDFANSQLVQIHANYFFMNIYSPNPGHIHMRQMVMESMVEMAKDFSSKLYTQVENSVEEASASDRFPLSIRWRQAEVPMILLNQHDVQGYGGDGDISIFCRNLRRMRRASAQNWYAIAQEGRYRLVNFEQEERQRQDQLQNQGVVSEGEAGKRMKLDLLLKVVGAPDEGVRAQRVIDIIQKHSNYALTFDNMLKMIAIYFRVKAGIPVLIMGETGCGKTKLMEFLSDVLQIKLFKCDVHGGFTSDLIIEFMAEPIAHAKKTPDFMVWVFLDEVNTSPEVGLFKEIICDHSLYGQALPSNLIVLGALNPVRRRRKDYAAGLERHDMAGVETYMNNLVYRVYPLPETMKEYIWNFGALDELDESQYVGEMLNLSFKADAEGTQLSKVIQHFGDKLTDYDIEDILDKVRITFQRCLVECQKFIRKANGGEVSCVSLRDVARCINIFDWFLEHYNFKEDKKLKGLSYRDRFFKCLQKSCILAIAHCYYYRLGGSRPQFGQEMDKIIIKPVFVQRELNLGDEPMENERFRKYAESLKKHDRDRFIAKYKNNNRFGYRARGNRREKVQMEVRVGEKIQEFVRVISSEQDRYVNLMKIPPGVAKNRSLKENLFMILVCVMTRLPIVLVGKPGSSKTLSMILMRDNLAASTKRKELTEEGFNDVYLVPFQCSKHTTAASIRQRWDFAASYQEADPSVRVMVFFDEIGLAEESPHRPLKVFHQLLEKPVLSFAGLSNWALDGAKMNRAILHNCPQHDFGDLRDTAIAIVENSTDNPVLIQMLTRNLDIVCKIYANVLKLQKIADFFGARDFYACVQMITTNVRKLVEESDRMELEIPQDLFFEAIVRSFGGMEEETLRNLLADALTKADQKKYGDRSKIMKELEQWNGVRAVDRNLYQTRTVKDVITVGSQARHIMVLTDFETSWQVLFDSNILDQRAVVIFGSQFRQDLNSSVNLYHSINRVKNCIEAGVVVILLHLEDLHDALYDMLNQRYTRIGKRLYCRIAMGAESVICQVHPHFKCIVVGNKHDAYTGKIPVAFLNRFEKQVIDRRQLMGSVEKEAENILLKELSQYKVMSTHLTSIDRLFPGFMDESIPSLFSVLMGENKDLTAEELVKAAKPKLLENAYAEVFAKSNADFEPYTDLVAALEEKYVLANSKAESPEEKKDTHVLIRTHDRILASEEIEAKFEDSKLNVRVVQLDEFQTELELSHFFEQFTRQQDHDALILQCNHKGANIPHILHAKHMMEERKRGRDRKQHEEEILEQNDAAEAAEEAEASATAENEEPAEVSVKADALVPQESGGGDLKTDAEEDSEPELEDKVVPAEFQEKKEEEEEEAEIEDIEEVTYPKVWVLLVHTPRVKMQTKSILGRKTQQRVFPLVFDKIWESIYVDALIPSQAIGVPSLVELSQSRIPQLLRKQPSQVLLRVFRKALTQLRFVQPVKMFEEIQGIRDLLSENSWDGGIFLQIMQHRLLNILDNKEFGSIISEVVLKRIRNEAENQWIRGSFRDRLVTFVDKIFQTSFARELKLLYEHGNFHLYSQKAFAKLEDNYGNVTASEFRSMWIDTLSEPQLVTSTAMVITDRPDPIHVPHAYRSSFPFSFTLDTWTSSKRFDVEQLLVDTSQMRVAETLCNIIRAQGWRVDLRHVSVDMMNMAVSDLVKGHLREVYSLDEGVEEVSAIAESFIKQSAFENRYVLSEEENKDDPDDIEDDDLEERKANKAEISIWDIYPAYWYNQQLMAQLLRLFSILDPNVKEKIIGIWRSGISSKKESSIPSRVGETLKMSIASLSELLQNASPETISNCTQQIVAASTSVNGLLGWVANSGVLEEEWNEGVNLQWRLVRLKLLVSRHVSIDVDKRAEVFGMIDKAFSESALFVAPEGFVQIMKLTQEITKDSTQLCHVMRRYLELFSFTVPKLDMALINHLMNMIDPSKESLLGAGYALTDVAKGNLATEMLKQAESLVLGEGVTALIDERLGLSEDRDGELASLLLVVIEEIITREEMPEEITFADSKKCTLKWLYSLARAKRFINEYTSDLVKKISKPEETTLEQLGGEEKLVKLFSIISPNSEPFQPLHYYFLKMLFNGGIPFVQAFAKNPVVKENIVAKMAIMERVKVVEEVDPFVLAGNDYMKYKEEFLDVYRDNSKNFNLEVTEKTLRGMMLAMHTAVYRQTTLEEGPSSTLQKWLLSPEIDVLFRKNPFGKYMHRLAQNNFTNGSLLKYTPKFDKYSRWVSSLTFHMCASLSTLPENHLSIACHKPRKYLKGFVPAMPLDTSAALGNLVGAAAWVCPKGHVYYIGDCTRPWVTARCHCGEIIGGKSHVAQHGNQRLEAKAANRPAEPGYLLLGTPAEVKQMDTIRELDVMGVKIIRLLLHCAFLLGNSSSIRDFKGQDNIVFHNQNLPPNDLGAGADGVPPRAYADPNLLNAAAVNADKPVPPADPNAAAANADAPVPLADPNAAANADVPVPPADPNAAAANANAPVPPVDPNAAAADADAPVPPVDPNAAADEDAPVHPVDPNAADAPAVADEPADPAVAPVDPPVDPAVAPVDPPVDPAVAPVDPLADPAVAPVDPPADPNAAEAPAVAEEPAEVQEDAPVPPVDPNAADAPAAANEPADAVQADAAAVAPVDLPVDPAAAPADPPVDPADPPVDPDAVANDGDAPADPNAAPPAGFPNGVADLFGAEQVLDPNDPALDDWDADPNDPAFADFDPAEMQAIGSDELANVKKAQKMKKKKVPAKAVDYSDKSDIAKLMQGHGFGQPLQKYLFKQVIAYLEELARILKMNNDETVLFLHKIIDRFVETFASVFPDGIFELSEDNRGLFEEYFMQEVLRPLLPAQESVENLRKKHLEKNELLAEVWEKTDLTSPEGINFRETYLPHLMLVSQPVDFEQFSLTLCTDADNKANFPSLYALATARPSIWTIKHLPSMHKWCKIMMQRFNRKITRDDAKNMTVADVLQKVEEGNWGNKAEFAADWQEFVSCWNEIYRLINVDDHTRLDELRNECVHIYRYITPFSEDPKAASVAFLCPDEQDEGMITNTIVDHLVTVHNNFLTDAGLLSSNQELDMGAPTMNSDVCTKQNLVDVDKKIVSDLIRSHCVRALRYGSNQKLAFDMKALEVDIRDRYVLGKGEVRAMLPFFEFAGVAKIDSIFDTTGLPKERLDPDFMKLATNYQSGLERTRALENAEETILLLGRLGVATDGEQPIYAFMRDVLRMDREDYNLFNLMGKGDEIQLKHLHCIWSYLQKQTIYDDPKRLKVPEGTLAIYMNDLPEDLTKQLEQFMKDITLAEFEEIVFAWYDVLTSFGTEERNIDQKWKLYICISFENDKVLEKLPDLELQHCGKTYEFLATEFFRQKSGDHEEEAE